MASLIEGYEYDIFISYRQKDNKHDGWVTEFVNNLKGELESTFKEEISVYFDINPQDGLLETHDVDASLKVKLKCLVLIPIISRTFCDPKSFAWEHEFKAFVELASQDKFGLKIKLPNGNVASRVLPVRIHDLDIADIKECESVLESVLRGVEFIYKEPGVNRSLSPKDHEEKNLNNTNYRNQINKVALAIKEIILGLKTVSEIPSTEKVLQKPLNREVHQDKAKEDLVKPFKSNWPKLLSGLLITSILICAAIIAYPKIFKRDTLEKLQSSGGRISIAIMPFKNHTVDTSLDIWQLGLQNLLITSLSNSEELSVRQYETLDKILGGTENANYASLTPSFAADLAKKLEANTVIIGNLYKTGNRIRITANLMDSKTEEIYKSYEIDGNTEDDFFPITDSLSKLIMNFLELKKLVQKNNLADLKNIYTSSASALKYYIQARSYHGQLDYKSAIDFYKKSISMDTNFVSPMLMLSYIYGDLGKSEESKKWVYKAYDRINSVPHDIQLQIKEVKAAVNKEPQELIKYVKQYLEINPYSIRGLYAIGWASYNTEQWQAAIDAFEEGIKLNNKFSSKIKLWVWNYILLGNAYHKIGEHDKEMKIYEDGLNLWPEEESSITFWQAVCILSMGDIVVADKYLNKIKTIGQKEGWSESELLNTLAGIYHQAKLFTEAEELYRRALILNPKNNSYKKDLAYLLIDKDRNISEGVELIRQTVEENPDNPDFLFTYGLGLYKQGKFREALEFLEKSWELIPFYDHEHFLALEAAKKAVVQLK
jgi:tetratricopeptide (TPR) repeat protein